MFGPAGERENLFVRSAEFINSLAVEPVLRKAFIDLRLSAEILISGVSISGFGTNSRFQWCRFQDLGGGFSGVDLRILTDILVSGVSIPGFGTNSRFQWCRFQDLG